jgi:hypothetical protein
MADHIPFITSDEVCDLAKQAYPDSAFVRVPLYGAERYCPRLRATTKVWLDPCVDGMDDLRPRRSTEQRRNPWFEFMSGFPNFEKLGTPAYHAKPVAAEVRAFVKAVMDKCAACRPAWITIPQLPIVTDSKRNKINRALAAATGKWRSGSPFSGRLIVPLVFTHQSQIKLKKYRNRKVQQAEKCYDLAQADGLWVVESSLDDERGSSTLRKRFSSVIALHEELNDRIPSKIRIAGPYWGLNLVLWARNLVDYPAIGVGSGYQFLLTGGPTRHPSSRLMLTSLRRRVGVGTLEDWLKKASAKLDPSHAAHKEFSYIRKHYRALIDQDSARTQVATFYKQWYDAVAAVPSAGRSMALFQDLSAAFALGRSLPALGADEKTARRPEAVAEPLMLNCL